MPSVSLSGYLPLDSGNFAGLDQNTGVGNVLDLVG